MDLLPHGLGQHLAPGNDWDALLEGYNKHSAQTGIQLKHAVVDPDVCVAVSQLLKDPTKKPPKLEESDFMEFKQISSDASAEHDDHMYFEALRAVCGFLNGRGGVIIFGVNDEGEVPGVKLSAAKAEELKQGVKRGICERFEGLVRTTANDEAVPHKVMPPGVVVARVVVFRRWNKAQTREYTRRLLLFAMPFCRHSAFSNRYFTYDGIGYVRSGTATIAISRHITMPSRRVSSSAGRQSSRLPVYSHPDNIPAKLVATVNNNRVTFITGATGCGKSSQVPKILSDGLTDVDQAMGFKIIVAQQKRLCTVALAHRVAAEYGSAVGERVGYHIGGRRAFDATTRILFVTTSMLRVYGSTGRLTRFNVVIVDEVHERDIDTDLCLQMLRSLICQSADLRLVLMSATLAASELSGYFTGLTGIAGEPAPPIVDIPTGSTHPVQVVYPVDQAGFATRHEIEVDLFDLDRPMLHQCVVAGMVDIMMMWERRYALKGLTKSVPAVLVFLPGIANILEVGGILSGRKNQCTLNLDVFMLHSTVDSASQKRALAPARPGVLKIVLATNIAESSLTVPDAGCVIDSCLVKSTVIRHGQLGLAEVWATQDSLIQRRGRVGRTMPGVVYRMIPEEFLLTLDKSVTPEICRIPLEDAVLRIIGTRKVHPATVLNDCPTPPGEANVEQAMTTLFQRRCIVERIAGTDDDEIGSNTGYGHSSAVSPGPKPAPMPSSGILGKEWSITPQGRLLSSLPLPIPAGMLILYGIAFGCVDEAIILAAASTRQSPIKSPVSKPRESLEAAARFSGGCRSDTIAAYNAYTWWLSERVHWTSSDEVTHIDGAWLSLFHLRELDDLVVQTREILSMASVAAQPRRLDVHRRNAFMVLDQKAEEAAANDEGGKVKGNGQEERGGIHGLDVPDITRPDPDPQTKGEGVGVFGKVDDDDTDLMPTIQAMVQALTLDPGLNVRRGDIETAPEVEVKDRRRRGGKRAVQTQRSVPGQPMLQINAGGVGLDGVTEANRKAFAEQKREREARLRELAIKRAQNQGREAVKGYVKPETRSRPPKPEEVWADVTKGRMPPITTDTPAGADRALVLEAMIAGAFMHQCYSVRQASETHESDLFWSDLCGNNENNPGNIAIIKPVGQPDRIKPWLKRELTRIHPTLFSGLRFMPAPTADSIAVMADPRPDSTRRFDSALVAPAPIRALAAVIRDIFKEQTDSPTVEHPTSVSTNLAPMFSTSKMPVLAGMSLAAPLLHPPPPNPNPFAWRDPAGYTPLPALIDGQALLVATSAAVGRRATLIHGATLLPLDLPSPKMSTLLLFSPTPGYDIGGKRPEATIRVRVQAALFRRSCHVTQYTDKETFDLTSQVRAWVSARVAAFMDVTVQRDISTPDIRQNAIIAEHRFRRMVKGTGHDWTADEARGRVVDVYRKIRVRRWGEMMRRIERDDLLQTAPRETLVDRADPEFKGFRRRQWGEVK